MGRTATHEVGHYLGLLHVDGDGDCSTDDFCTDTPPVGFKTSGCPSVRPLACDGSAAQIENYMDYTDDRCMNMFTIQQKARMRTVLNYSPRRKTLNSSPGLQPVTLLAHDARLEGIEQTQTFICDTEVALQVTIRNMGRQVLNSLIITYIIDNSETLTFHWQGSLPSLVTTLVNLPTMQVSRGRHQIRVTLSLPNGHTNPIQPEAKEASFVVLPIQAMPLQNDFSDTSMLASSWPIINPDNQKTWEVTKIELAENNENQVLRLPGFDYEHINQQDYLLSPILTKPTNEMLALQFKVAYAPYNNGDGNISQDGLKIGITTDCGKTFTIVYDKRGSQLATAAVAMDSWTPSQAKHWRTESIDLSSWLNTDHFQVAFIGVNAYGNNIFLDDILLTSQPTSSSTSLVKVTPNPGHSQEIRISLNLPQPVDVLHWSLMDLKGQIINQGHILNAQFQSWGVSKQILATGIYILRLYNAHHNITKRVIVYSE